MYEAGMPEVQCEDKVRQWNELSDQPGVALCQILDRFTREKGFFDVEDVRNDPDVATILSGDLLAKLGPLISEYRMCTVERLQELGVIGDWIFPNESLLKEYDLRPHQMAFLTEQKIPKQVEPFDIIKAAVTNGRITMRPAPESFFRVPQLFTSREDLSRIYDDAPAPACSTVPVAETPVADDVAEVVQVDGAAILSQADIYQLSGLTPNPSTVDESMRARLQSCKDSLFGENCQIITRDNLIKQIADLYSVDNKTAEGLVSALYQLEFVGRSADGRLITADPRIRRQKPKARKSRK